MRRTKSGPALFEVLSREQTTTSDTFKTPEWWSPLGRDEGSRARVSGNEDPVDSPGCRGESAGRTREKLPFLELVGSQLQLTFTSGTAAVAVFLLMITVVVGYDLGRRSGDAEGVRRGYEAGRASFVADALDEIQLARTQPPQTHVVESLIRDSNSATEEGVPGPNEDPTEANATQWIRGYTYIVAQEFAPERSEDAELAQAYLAQHGIATALVRLSGGTIQLITTQGYNRRDATQRGLADRLLQKEQAIGGKYFAGGGQYRLKGYFRTLKGDSW